MICTICGKDSFSYHNIESQAICDSCYNNKYSCRKCGKHAETLSVYSYCCACHSDYLKILADPRIQKLKETPAGYTEASSKELPIDFDSLNEEAFCAAQIQRNYEMIGVGQGAPLNEIRDKCKEIIKSFHNDSYKDGDAQSTSLASKIEELKKAYNAIVEYREKPYKILELKYGASKEDVFSSYKNMLKLYDPENFKEDKELRQKVSLKRSEIIDTYNILIATPEFMGGGNKSGSQLKTGATNAETRGDLNKNSVDGLSAQNGLPLAEKSSTVRTPLQTVLCENCGNQVNEDDRLCEKCGVFLDLSSQTHRVYIKVSPPVGNIDEFIEISCPNCRFVEKISNNDCSGQSLNWSCFNCQHKFNVVVSIQQFAKVSCPHCSFIREVPIERLPHDPVNIGCIKCNQRFMLGPVEKNGLPRIEKLPAVRTPLPKQPQNNPVEIKTAKPGTPVYGRAPTGGVGVSRNESPVASPYREGRSTSSPFLLLRCVRAVFGLIAGWQVIGLLPVFSWIQNPGAITGNLMVMLLVKVIAFVFFGGIFFGLGALINNLHKKKHGTMHPTVKNLLSV